MDSIFLNIDEIFSEIKLSYHWKDKYIIDNKQHFDSFIRDALDRWSRLMIALSSSKNFDIVDDISSELKKLRIHLKDIFPKVNFYFSIII